MASAFLPLLSYDDAESSEAAVASVAQPQTPAASAAAPNAEPQPARRTIAVPPAPAGSRNEAGLDTGVLDSVLRRFRAVDLSGEPPKEVSPAAAANPTPAAAKKPAAAGGKPALKKKAPAPPTPEEAAKAAQLAAEAAARRAAAEATLRAKQERSRAALAAVEWMLEHTAASEDELREHALGPLTSAEFEEGMRERALSGLCGCPLCDAPLTRPDDVGKMRVSLRQRKVYRSEAPLFCGEACATRARAIQVALPEESPLPVLAKQGTAAAPVTPAAPVPPAAPAPKAPAAAFGVGGSVTMTGSIVEHAAPRPDPGAQPLPDAPGPGARAAAAASVEGFAPRAEARHVRWADGGAAAAPQEAPPPAPQPRAGRSAADVSSSVSYDIPERLSASYYHTKVERALAAARARGEQAAEEARDAAPPTAAQAASEETAAAEAFVRGWAEAIDGAPEAPEAAARPPIPQAGPSAPPSAAGSGGATFVFDVLSEGAFGAGVRRDDDDPSAPRGAGLTNMGQFAYGELKIVREDDDGGRRPSRRRAGGSDDEDDEAEEDDEALDDEIEETEEAEEAGAGDDSGAEEAGAGDDSGAEEAELNAQERDADDDDGWAAERYGATGGDYDDNASGDDDEEDDEEDAAPAVKGAHPLFEPATPEMRPRLSPFLAIWTALDSWVTPATLAFLSSAPDAPAAGAAQLSPGALPMSPAEAEAASRRAPPLRARESGEVMQALAAGLDRAMPAVCAELGLRVPVSAIDTALQALLRTFAFRGAAPSLSAPRWALLLLLLLEPLGRVRLPQLGADLASERAHRGQRALLDAAGFTPEQHAALREPLAWARA